MKHSIRLVNKTKGILWWKKISKVYQIICEEIVREYDYHFGYEDRLVTTVVAEVDTLEEAELELELWKINEV